MPSAPAPSPDLLPLLRGVSRSFYLSIRVLPSGLRRPIAVAYLLARATDTVADEVGVTADERLARLERLGRAIAGDTLVGNELPTLHGAGGTLEERELMQALPHCLEWLDELDAADREDVRAVLRPITRGQSFDVQRFGADGAVVALDNAEQLDEYTYLVAGCVGEFWTKLCARHLPGFATLPQEEMHRLGRSFGMGLQLVNILRDLGEDLRAGRCYLPASELTDLGLAPASIIERPEALAPVWDRWLARAQQGLEDGMRYAQAVNSRRVRAACALPALIGARTIALLRNAGPRGAIEEKVKVPRAQVRSIMLSLLFSLASRGNLQRQWDNPRP